MFILGNYIHVILHSGDTGLETVLNVSSATSDEDKDVIEVDGMPAGRGIWGKCSLRHGKTFIKRSLYAKISFS